MSSNINISLTNELREFVDNNTGDGSLYTTPGEFLRNLIREKKERLESAALRMAVTSGFQDEIEGRVHQFSGDLRKDMEAFQKQNQE